MTKLLQAYVLGEFRLYRDGILVSSKDWHTSQARQLFKLLLTERGKIVSAQRLADLLWAEAYAESAHKTLRSATSALRDVLEPDRQLRTPSRFVPRGHGGYRLLLPADDTLWIDAVEFESLLDQARREQDKSRKEKLLDEALQLYAGEYLAEDENARWALPERRRLRERYLTTATTLMEMRIETGHYDEAIQIGRRALVVDAYSEPLYRLIMYCQANQGNTAGALQTFEYCRQLLDDQLGADPSPQTLALHIAILRGEFQEQPQQLVAVPHTASVHPSSQEIRTHRKSVEDGELPVTGHNAELRWFEHQLTQLHHFIAERLITYSIVQRETPTVEISSHYQQSGQHPLQALYSCVIAGDYARRTFSYRQAIVQYDAALQLLHHLTPSSLVEQGFDIEEWYSKAHAGRMLACEALLDWEGMEESYDYVRAHALNNGAIPYVGRNIDRRVFTRSLMGYLPEAASMSQVTLLQLQDEVEALQHRSSHDRRCIEFLIDISQHWARLLTPTGLTVPFLPNQQAILLSSHFPPFVPAPRPSVHDWYEMKERLGAAQAAFVLFEYGWILLLQGLLSDAEQCLQWALQAAEETNQDICWIHASMLLSNIFASYGRHEEATEWSRRCFARCQQLSEATWVSIWPLLNKAYYALNPATIETAKRVFHQLERQMAHQQGFQAHYYSMQIGLGLAQLVQGELELAKVSLQDALKHEQQLYIEAYVLAEQGLANIARQQGQDDEACQRYHKLLTFCGQRSLLSHYSSTALALAELLIKRKQKAGIADFLIQLNQHLNTAGFADLHQQSSMLLTKLRQVQ